MKKAFLYLGLFLGIGFILLNNIIAPSLIKHVFYKEDFQNVFSDVPTIMYKQLRRSRNIPTGPVVLLGDSVANQLFDERLYGPYFYDLTVYASAAMVGQYILMKNVLATGPKVDSVVLLYQPRPFMHNLNMKSTYNHFVNPFYTFEYKKNFTGTVYRRLNQHPLCRLGLLPAFKVTKFCSWVDYSDGAPIAEYLSEISIEYLRKMMALAAEQNIKLIIHSTPVSKKTYEVANYDQFRTQIDENGFGQLFEGYFDSILYLDDELFSDGIHFKKEYLDEYRRRFYQMLLDSMDIPMDAQTLFKYKFP